MMNTPKKIILAGSHKAAHSAGVSANINRNEVITVTVRIRRKRSIEAQLKATGYITHEDYEKEYGASQADVNKVEAFARQYHLSAVEIHLARRSVIFSGSIANMEKAFGVTLSASTDTNGNQI